MRDMGKSTLKQAIKRQGHKGQKSLELIKKKWPKQFRCGTRVARGKCNSRCHFEIMRSNVRVIMHHKFQAQSDS